MSHIPLEEPGHIEALWLTYREILPKDAGPVQMQETKKAFFAGAAALFDAAMGPLFDEGHEEVTEGDERRIAEIQLELEAFGRSGGRT